MPLIFRKQPSGGRGEYELVGETGGVTAADLLNHGFTWDTPFGLKETEVALSGQGGKRRLRLTRTGVPHVHRQAATLALLPRSIRDEGRVTHGEPIVLRHGYILDVQVSLVSLDASMAVVRPSQFIARSGPASDAEHSVTLNAEDRFQRLMAVWDRADLLPEAVSEVVLAHRQRLFEDTTVGQWAEKSVEDVITALEELPAPDYIPGADPLPALEVMAGLAGELELPVPTAAPEALPEIRIRLESAYRRARARGASHQRFKKQVQEAYGYRCVFCGMQALDIPGLSHSGVDAAHILPWGKYDLDVIQNGILLCKRDHWAFDSHVLLLRHSAGRYDVEINPRYAELIRDRVTQEALGQAVGRIPLERLPRRQSYWPAPEFITKLYEGLEP